MKDLTATERTTFDILVLTRGTNGFPKEVFERMVLECMKHYGNLLHEAYDIVLTNPTSAFSWDNTKEGTPFWYNIIGNEDFTEFYKRYPSTGEIAGYKVKDKYLETVRKIFECSMEPFNGYHFQKNSTMYNKLLSLDVFELWCEPVYREKEFKLPEINGYKGELSADGTYIKYGCAELDVKWFAPSGNRIIESMTLNSGVVIETKEVNQIREFLKSKGKLSS